MGHGERMSGLCEKKQVSAVGQLNLAAIEVTKSVAGAGLKITPDIMVGGSADGGGSIFAAFIAQLLASQRGPMALPASSGPAGGGQETPTQS